MARFVPSTKKAFAPARDVMTPAVSAGVNTPAVFAACETGIRTAGSPIFKPESSKS